MSIHKRYLKIFLIIFFLLYIFSVRHKIVYYFSDDFLGKDEVLKLKNKASKGDYNASYILFIHYHYMFFREKEANKWANKCIDTLKR
jgi:hypothetical protein